MLQVMRSCYVSFCCKFLKCKLALAHGVCQGIMNVAQFEAVLARWEIDHFREVQDSRYSKPQISDFPDSRPSQGAHKPGLWHRITFEETSQQGGVPCTSQARDCGRATREGVDIGLTMACTAHTFSHQYSTEYFGHVAGPNSQELAVAGWILCSRCALEQSMLGCSPAAAIKD